MNGEIPKIIPELLETKNDPELELLRKRLEVLEKRKGIWGNVGSFLYEHRQFCVGLVLGFLLSVTFSPFAGRGISLPNWFPKPNITITSGDTPAKIANDSPKDQAKRKILIQVYRSTSTAIQEKELTELDDVMSTLRQETISVLSSPEWKEIMNRINKLVQQSKDLESLSGLLEEIADKLSN
jgi:hypothetical protein